MNIASFIDHTILKPTTTAAEVEQLCREATEHHFAAVCVPPAYVRLACQRTSNSTVKVATVIGFPFGYSSTASKVQEIKDALNDGADELDLVHNLTALKNGDWHFLEEEVKACVAPVHAAGKIIKLIVESGLLTDEELVKCCELYSRCHIDCMKTSTGYAATGATIHAVKLMRQHLPSDIFIKASGGIRNFSFAKELIEAGAGRLGCSASITIVSESQSNKGS